MHPECKRVNEAEQQKRRQEAEAERVHEEREKEQRRQEEEKERQRKQQEFFSQAMAKIERGDLTPVPVPPGVILLAGEQCFAVIKSWRAQIYPTLLGRRARVVGNPEVRDDGIVRKELGDLFVTDRRVFFVSPAKVVQGQIKKLLGCSTGKDVLHVMFSGRSTGLHFIIPDSQILEIISTLIRKVATITKGKPAKSKIECYIWRCHLDSQTCSACRMRQGTEWDRKKDIDLTAPLSSCENPDGCRCQITPPYSDEVYDPEAGLEP